MRKVLCVILLLMMLSGCRSYHKLDFIVVNNGLEYLDSIHHAGRPLMLQYPADAFKEARPYLQNKYGRDYKKFKPYIIEIVDDSLWAVWTNPNFRYLLTGQGRLGSQFYGITVSMYDGKLKSYKHVK